LHLPIVSTHDSSSGSSRGFYLSFLAILIVGTMVVAYCSTLRADQLPASPDQFARDILRQEVEAQSLDNVLWTFREEKQDDGKRKLLHVYQTKQGQIDRLVELDGHPLTSEQVRAEDRRIQKLISHPGELRQHQKKQREDGEQARKLLRMFPDAFRFEYDGQQGPLIRLKFAPNLKFHPPDHAAQVFHHMNGTMLIDAQQQRLAAIDGVLTSEVKFFGGVFGHLDEGGTFSVRQQEISPRVWEVTAMHVHMKGKALLFKTIAVQEDEIYSDFHTVPVNITPAQAAELLKQDSRDVPQTQAKN